MNVSYLVRTKGDLTRVLRTHDNSTKILFKGLIVHRKNLGFDTTIMGVALEIVKARNGQPTKSYLKRMQMKGL